jgi:ribonuclease III
VTLRGDEAAPAAPTEGARAHAALEAALGHVFADASRLETALQHPSYAHEIHGSSGNERLEFLGDAVLGLVAARLLFEAHGDWDEGHLSRARAALVNTGALATHARALGIPTHARLGRTERAAGTGKDTVLANLFEAVVGAVYLDGGIDPVMALARRLFAAALTPGADVATADPKTRLQEWAHAELRSTPRYATVHDSGLENDEQRFEVEVRIDGEVWGRARARTKRAAERGAAEEALGRRPAP